MDNCKTRISGLLNAAFEHGMLARLIVSTSSKEREGEYTLRFDISEPDSNSV